MNSDRYVELLKYLNQDPENGHFNLNQWQYSTGLCVSVPFIRSPLNIFNVIFWRKFSRKLVLCVSMSGRRKSALFTVIWRNELIYIIINNNKLVTYWKIGAHLFIVTIYSLKFIALRRVVLNPRRIELSTSLNGHLSSMGFVDTSTSYSHATNPQ